MEKNAVDAPVPERPENLLDQFAAFVDVVRILRKECPWDREQTHDSIAHLLIEEAYETLDAISQKDDKEFSKELGDLLLHVVMHGVIAEERKAFQLQDVMRQEREKLVHRHPHVFGSAEADNSDAVLQKWEQMKMKERGRTSVLQGVPVSLPALLRAQRSQEKVANVGFDWEKPADVWEKVREELEELRAEALAPEPSQERIAEEYGDLLFSMVNAARFSGIVAEDALQRANSKFTKRFQALERLAAERSLVLSDMTLEAMDELWNEVKRSER